MRLWQKIFLWTLFIVMAAVSTTGIMILRNNYKTSIERQVESTRSEHEYMISNLKNKIMAERIKNGAYILPTDSIVSLMSSIFNITDNKESDAIQLYDTDGNVLYQNLPIKDSKELFNIVINGADSYRQIINIKNKYYLLIASKITLEKQDFVFITRTDITELYNMYSEQLSFTKLLSIVLSLACAFFLLILVKLLLRPLTKLNVATTSIAAGDYSKRIDYSGHDELSELTKNMNIMANSIEENVTLLQETAENRKQFINNLSHEMKTPLTSILGFADIMRIKRSISEDELAEYSEIIFEEATRLKNLSGKLMELITVGETNLEFTIMSTGDLFNQLKLILIPVLKKNEIILDTSYEDCNLSVDAELFKSMIFNIIDNAIKASAKGDTIYVTGEFTSPEKTKYKICIKDNGIGIDEKELLKITEPFYMVDKARSRKAGGAGLGLALCLRIAKIHDSILNITSTKNVGTVVSIELNAYKEGV